MSKKLMKAAYEMAIDLYEAGVINAITLREYFKHNEVSEMSDLKNYIKKRKTKDKTFAKNYDEGFTEFKIGFVLRTLRESR